MTSYEKIALDERGLAFILDHLRGVNPFCDQLAAVVEQKSGQVFTLLPLGTGSVRTYGFQAGGILAENLDYSRAISIGPGKGALMPVSSLRSLRAQLTLEALEYHPGSICICDDFNPEWSERVAAHYPSAFGVGLKTYHLLTKEDGVEDIARVLGEADALWHGASAVCLRGLTANGPRVVSEETLAASAASAMQITCTAYDREGFVVWQQLLD
jgi:hypothetical protein